MLNQIISYEDKQRFLKLRDSHVLSVYCPKFLESSISVAQTRRTEMKGGSRNMQTSSIVPRINGDKPLKMLSDMIKGDFGKVRDHLSTLFELGLGVPQQKDIALFIREAKNDEDTIAALKEVRKMVVAYQNTYEESLNTEFFYPAPYIAHIQSLNAFVSDVKHDGALQYKVPKGIPVLLIYRVDNPVAAEFVLTDAYDMTTGLPTPFAHIMLRSQIEFPRTLISQSIKKHSSYLLVFGYLTSSKGLNYVAELCEAVDIDDNVDLTKEHKAELAELEFTAVGLGIQSREGQFRSANSNIQKTLRVFKAMGFSTECKSVKHDRAISYYPEANAWGI